MVDADGLSPLMHAVLSAKLNNVLALLEYGAEVNAVTELSDDIIVNKSAKRYTEECSLLFMKHHRSMEGVRIPVTALHLACMRGDLPLIYGLLANGANPHVVVQGPLPELCGTPRDFYARFAEGLFPRDFLMNQASTEDFLADCWEDIDVRVFRIYLHKSGMVNASSRATCITHIRRCAALLGGDLFGNTQQESLHMAEQELRSLHGFSECQKGGVARSIKRFMEYTKSSMRQKYNRLDALGLV